MNKLDHSIKHLFIISVIFLFISLMIISLPARTKPTSSVTYYVEITWRLREEERDSASETKTIRWVMQI